MIWIYLRNVRGEPNCARAKYNLAVDAPKAVVSMITTLICAESFAADVPFFQTIERKGIRIE